MNIIKCLSVWLAVFTSLTLLVLLFCRFFKFQVFVFWSFNLISDVSLSCLYELFTCLIVYCVYQFNCFSLKLILSMTLTFIAFTSFVEFLTFTSFFAEFFVWSRSSFLTILIDCQKIPKVMEFVFLAVFNLWSVLCSFSKDYTELLFCLYLLSLLRFLSLNLPNGKFYRFLIVNWWI